MKTEEMTKEELQMKPSTTRFNYYCLTAILMQELFENDIFNIEELSKKYTMNKAQETALEELYNVYYGQFEE